MSRIRIFGVIAAVVLAIGVATAGVAEGAKVKNGNFEKGSFKNWKTKTTPSDLPAPPRGVILTTRWRLYTKQDRDIGVLMRPPYARGGHALWMAAKKNAVVSPNRISPLIASIVPSNIHCFSR